MDPVITKKNPFMLKITTYWKLLSYGWHIAIIAIPILVVWLVFGFFHKAPMKQNIRVEKGATLINNVNQEKVNEAGIFGGGARLGDKNGVFAGIEYKRKF